MRDMTPILCRACGGPVAPIDDVHIVCPFCATKDELPREAHARVSELRRRLMARAQTIDQLSRADLALAFAFERPVTLLRVMLPMAPFTLMMLAKLPLSFRATIHPTALDVLGDLYLAVGLPLAIALALLFARRRYFREVWGNLQACPPAEPAGLARCRCCGASLPEEHGPLIRCRHCNTYSLVTLEHQRRGAGALAAEDEARRRQRGAVARHVSTTSPGIDRAFYFAFVLIFFGGWPLLGAIVLAFTA